MKLLEKDLFLDPEEAIRSICPIDKTSGVPPHVQRYGAYFVNEKGVHKLVKESGEFDIEEVWKVPFWVSNSTIDIEENNITVTITILKAGKATDYVMNFNDINSLFPDCSKEQFMKIRKYVSYSLLKVLGRQKKEVN